MTLFVALVLAYLLGGIPTAYLAGKWVKGVDIRQQGSGNVGATNAVRVLGKPVGFAVFAIDFLKGLAPVLCASLLVETFPWATDARMLLVIGLAAILGHVFTPFLGFRGGKGVATGAGVLCGIYPLILCCAFAVWGAVFLVSRKVSLSSLAAAGSLPVLAWIFDRSQVAVGAMAGLFIFTLWSHRGNIWRLLKGEGC